MVLGDASLQLGPFLLILGHFLFLGVGLGLDMKWAGVPRSFGPIIAPQNPAAQLLERG